MDTSSVPGTEGSVMLRVSDERVGGSVELPLDMVWLLGMLLFRSCEISTRIF